MHRTLIAVALLALLPCLAGCDDGGGDPPSDTSSDQDIDTTPPPEDIVIMEVDIAEEDFVLGSHGDFVSEEVPEDFEVLQDGSYLPIITGGQGINMVLVGFQTNAALTEPMIVQLRLDIDGELHSRTSWDFQRFLVDQGDGWRGLYNMFLALDGCDTIPEGAAGAFTLTVTDATGQQYTRRIEVTVGENDLCFG